MKIETLQFPKAPHIKQTFEDTEGVFRSRRSKTDRQYNGQKERDNNTMARRRRTDNTMARRKGTNNDPQNTTQKPKIEEHELH